MIGLAAAPVATAVAMAMLAARLTGTRAAASDLERNAPPLHVPRADTPAAKRAPKHLLRISRSP